MTDLALLLLLLVLVQAFVIVRFELRFTAYLRTVQGWTSNEEEKVNALRERVARLEALAECRARRECPLCEVRA